MTGGHARRRAAFYTGNYHAGDGIGRALDETIAALRGGPDGEGWDITVFCQSSDRSDPDVHIGSSLQQVVESAAFRTADVHIFEFGWAYELMDALLFVPPDSRAIVHYHGITPARLIPDKPGFLSSWKQQFTLHAADAVLCSSRYASDVLTAFGLDAGNIRLAPLPVVVLPREAPTKARDGPIQLLQVCRLVPHKGALDLVRALALLPPGFHECFRLKIAGSQATANQEYLAQLRGAITAAGLEDFILLVGAGDDTFLSDLYAAADALIVPSYHDTYCLPLAEAQAHGCHVIAYDNSNLPHAAAGLGRIVPTGDIAALSAAIADFVAALAGPGRADGTAPIATDRGPMEWRRLQQAARAQTEIHSRASFAQLVRDIISETLQSQPAAYRSRLLPADIFEDPPSLLIRPADLRPKEPYCRPGCEILEGDRIVYARETFAAVTEPLLFYGPYIRLAAGRWRISLDADIVGRFALKLTHDFGTPIAEAIVSDSAASLDFVLDEPVDKFETLLFAPPDAVSLTLRGLRLDRAG